MSSSSPVRRPDDDTRALIGRVREGDAAAFDRLFRRVYDELRQIAHQRLRQHRPGETLDTTALVHEAYLRLVDRSEGEWGDRAHFLAVASRAMRFIIIDYARARTADKRGGRRPDLRLDEVEVGREDRVADLLALGEALERLAASSERLAAVVEYRFFGGLTYEEIAEVTGRSIPTVKRDWARARTWLYRWMRPVEG